MANELSKSEMDRVRMVALYENLKKFYEMAEVKPKFMCIICGLYNAVVKRNDGIYVFPITALKP